MRLISTKSLCLLAGLFVPALGTTTQAQAGVIPWLYDSIFGYGWGGHGYGYGGGMPYTVGYGGYGSAYAAPTYAAPMYSAPVMSAPVVTTPGSAIPSDGIYNAHYGPVYGYSEYPYSYTAGYGPVYGSCCDPCNACATGGCATPVETDRAASPTPIDDKSPANPRKGKGLPEDDMKPAKDKGVEGGVGTDEALPADQNRPIKRGNMVPPVEMEEPVEEEETQEGPPPGTNEQGQMPPTDRNVATRQLPAPQRMKLKVPKSVARVVRVDRSVREQLVNAPARDQLAAKE